MGRGNLYNTLLALFATEALRMTPRAGTLLWDNNTHTASLDALHDADMLNVTTHT
jgi:hypothetical protein